LISKLEAWAKEIASGDPDAPRILLLVGGPGNGKTEAIEHTIKCLDQELGAGGRLLTRLAKDFHPPTGHPVPRMVTASAGNVASSPMDLTLDIVQDASVTAGHDGKSAPALLLEELAGLRAASGSRAYLCCVNRGVLDDALILALDEQRVEEQALLESIARAVSLSATPPSCWPLAGHPSVAVWPMDAESLLASPPDGSPSPASILLANATDAQYWPVQGSCAAGPRCPYCHSRSLLERDDQRDALLQVLRWYELASGKRWSFRDLFSLVSYLMAGHQQAQQRTEPSPCIWAAGLLRLDEAGKQSRRPTRLELTAIFQLATSSYQHALFHSWDHAIATALANDTKELGLGDHDQDAARTLRGLQYFLQDRKASYLPATIAPVLSGLVGLMDPALASPDIEVPLGARSKAALWDLDSRFSRSLADGLEFIGKRHALSQNETDLLKRLAAVDALLSSPTVRRKRPASAARIQRTLRDFACRLVRRSICTRSAVVLDAATLGSFQRVVEDGQGRRLFEVAQQIKNLLNRKHGFEVSLTTTFGQPLPPPRRQAILVVPPQPVRPLPIAIDGRPQPPLRFLQVGQGSSAQPIALTYDLFKAVEELERGLSPASLPQSVVALLDTTRARLAGPVVRDWEALADARIRIGADGVEVGLAWDGFVVLDKEGQA
jgi:hypothetical protein